MMEAFAMILCVAFGIVIGAVWQSLQDWRMAEAERRERERGTRWTACYPPVEVVQEYPIIRKREGK